jgi:hypothetical protein
MLGNGGGVSPNDVDTTLPPVLSFLWNTTDNGTTLGDSQACDNVKWTPNTASWKSFVGLTAEVATMRVRWCHHAWTIQAAAVQYEHKPGSWAAGFYVQEGVWDDEVHYWNDYGHGTHSEWCIKRTYHFDVCAMDGRVLLLSAFSSFCFLWACSHTTLQCERCNMSVSSLDHVEYISARRWLVHVVPLV